tara:strand:- start:5339 stop:5683 length:345 start_codon:yes stop_codon:yes gene_type:complete
LLKKKGGNMTYKTKMVNGVEVKLTADEIKELEARDKEWAEGEKDRNLALIRSVRLGMLEETDFYGMSDVTMSSDMKTYRQALRDVTNGLDTVEKTRTKLEQDSDGSYKNFPTKP